MTKQKFLEQLKKELAARNVPDSDEIVADYEDHFRFKTEEGRSEEEIAAKLQSPEEIAEEYVEVEVIYEVLESIGTKEKIVF